MHLMSNMIIFMVDYKSIALMFYFDPQTMDQTP